MCWYVDEETNPTAHSDKSEQLLGLPVSFNPAGHSVRSNTGCSQFPAGLLFTSSEEPPTSSERQEMALSMSLDPTRTTPHRRIHSFMAAHENETTPLLSDDLQQLFALASTLLLAGSAKTNATIDTIQESKVKFMELVLTYFHSHATCW